MNDCPNGDVRDLLPDLVHDRIDGQLRAVVEAHLLSCADCRAEFSMLSDARAALRRTPVLDLASITAAIPAYRAPVRHSWASWKNAAAITVLVVGGASVALLQRDPTSVDPSRVVAVVPQTLPVPAPAVTAVPSLGDAVKAPMPATSVGREPLPVNTVPLVIAVNLPPEAGRELAMEGGYLNDLSDRELSSLLKAIENLDALPTVEVEPASVSPMGPRLP